MVERVCCCFGALLTKRCPAFPFAVAALSPAPKGPSAVGTRPLQNARFVRTVIYDSRQDLC